MVRKRDVERLHERAAPSSSPTHRAILREALLLFGERGYGGASLRELARRVGVQQPSLYHYFKSKDELLDQVFDYVGSMFDAESPLPLPEHLEDVPAMLAETVVLLYDHTDWPHFVRFVLSLSGDGAPRIRRRVRALLDGQSTANLERMFAPFIARGEIDERDATFLGRAVLNAVGLLLIEQRLVYPGEPTVLDARAFARFVGDLARDALQSRRASRSR